MTDEDSILVAQVASGNRTEFSRMVEKYSPRLLATAGRITGDDADAQDVVQETFISAWKGIKDFRGESSIGTWLHRITVNGALDRLRSPNRQHEMRMTHHADEADLPFEGLPSAWAEPGPDLEKRVAMRRSIQKALSSIPVEFRTVLILRDVEEFTSREVAEKLRITDSAVRQRLHRARAAMAELLRPELCDSPELRCGGQLDLLFDYIDQSLPADVVALVTDHVKSCPTCVPLLDIYRTTVELPRLVTQVSVLDQVDSEWVSEVVRKAAGDEL